ncbi:unnamed protein product, partial [Phaeothamnion confervicola]
VWRSFSDNTKASSLLKQLYGTSVAIDYPKPSVRPREHTRRFSASGSSSNNHGISNKTRPTVAAPRVGGPPRAKTPAPIDALEARRRSKYAIAAEMEQTRTRVEGYRPPNIKAVATDDEKERLAERFAYGGGKGLPDELTAPRQPIPSEERARQLEEQRVAAAWRRRRG